MADYIKDLMLEYRMRFKEEFPVYEYSASRELIEECLDKNTKVQELYPLDYNEFDY